VTGARPSPVWHPFTQHGLMPEFKTISRADGAWLHAEDGSRYLDAIASWWVITHGHCHPRIQSAIRRQAETLDQIIFANFTHQPAEELAARLVEITPAGLDYVFYSDSGSTSVEVALKMALGFWLNSGTPRHRIVTLQHGYHGDTIGTMSAGERGGFTRAYEPLLFEVETLPFPEPGREQATLDALEVACRVSPPPAALIVEPLVLGAGGMRIYGAATLAQMKRICERFEVLLIADEVMTGWGRTGTLFACEQAGVVPDIACYSKGLTGGSLPLAVTMCAARIFEAHFSDDRRKTFFHSSSYTANPIACAAALENLRIWQDEPIMDRIGRITAEHRRRLPRLAAIDGVSDTRQIGTIAAFEIDQPGTDYFSGLGPIMQRFFFARGQLIRPLGNTVYMMPPYCVTDAELGLLYDTVAELVAELHHHPEKIMS
jgi:adenosylmethionine-8-amino-7-oxononanoate aminotransferase